MYFVHPTTSECFILHLILTIVLSATSFEHFWTIDDTKHLTFQAAYRVLGLLQTT
jgi:predicted nucleotidyltransferase